MNAIIIDEKENISSRIYQIRGVQVMLSSDIAKLYEVETKVLNQTIKRNINRFPETFCFQLTKEEIINLSLRSQFVTLNSKDNMKGQHYKYLPYVLTEQGIMMLSGLLKSEIAAKVNIQIIEAFVTMRKYISNDLYKNNNILINHENRLLKLEETFDKMQVNKKISTIFYNGQIYDAYSILISILNNAKKEIIIIDNYAGKELLDVLKNIDKKILIISKNIDDILIKKYKEQYSNVEFKKLDIFHDRFIIIDRKVLYNFGTSLKDLGKKCFAINEMECDSILISILEKLDD